MVTKLIASFLFMITLIYIIICVALFDKKIEDTEDICDVKYRWFLIISIYIGRAIVCGAIMALITLIGYALLFA
jgi:hypothetical protein